MNVLRVGICLLCVSSGAVSGRELSRESGVTPDGVRCLKCGFRGVVDKDEKRWEKFKANLRR